MFITALCFIFLMKLRWPKNRSLYDTIYVLLQLLSLLQTLEKDMQVLQDNVHKLLETVEDFGDTWPFRSRSLILSNLLSLSCKYRCYVLATC